MQNSPTMTGEGGSQTPTARPPPFLISLFFAVVAACTVVMILFTACGFLGRAWWRFEQLSHFRVQYFWLLIAAACVLMIAGRRRLGWAAVLAASVNLSLIVPIYWPASTQ